jgi:hypothetical protein
MVSSDGEYEYFKTIAAVDLGAKWTGAASYDLEERIRRSHLRVILSTWAG